MCEVLPIVAGLRGSALSNLVVGAPSAQPPERLISPAVRPLSRQDSYDDEGDLGSHAPSSVYDHEMEDHFTALLPDDTKARDNAFFNGFYPPKFSAVNSISSSQPQALRPPNSGRYSIQEDLGLARTSSRREIHPGNLSGRSYGELSDADYRERRGRPATPSSAPRSAFSVFLPWTWFEDE